MSLIHLNNTSTTLSLLNVGVFISSLWSAYWYKSHTFTKVYAKHLTKTLYQI